MPRSISPKAPNQLSPEKELGLYDSALAEFQKSGVDAASVDVIARQAGVSKAAIYRRFSSKEALFQAVAMMRADTVAQRMESIRFDATQPVESLKAAARAIRSETLRNIEFNRLLIAETPRRQEVTQQARVRINKLLTDRMREFFNLLIAQGRMDDGDVETLIWTFFILSVGGFRPLFNVSPDGEEEERRLATDIALFIKGCGIH